MSIILNDNIDTRANKPTDNRFGPYVSTAAAVAAIPSYQRYIGLTVGVGTPVVEYWFESGITDLDLIQKVSAGNVETLTAGSGISITGTATNPIIAVTTPTQLTTNLSTDVIADASSSTKYPSVKAIKDYADSIIVGLLNDRGNYPASFTSPGNYPSTGGSGGGGAILKGDIWFISSAGFLNLIPVAVGASVRALVDSPGILTDTDWDIIDTGLGFVPENSANRVLNASGIVSDPTNTSNYVSVNALTEYLATIPPTTPTLQEVTDVGNITTNDITAFRFQAQDPGGDSSIYLWNGIAYLSGSGTIAYPTTFQAISFPENSGILAISVNGVAADVNGEVTFSYVDGSGTINYVPKWSSSSILTDSQIFDNGTNIGIGTATPGYKLDVNGEINTNNGIRIATNGAQTGFYGGANILDVWAGNNKIATWGLTGAGGTLYNHFAGWVYTTVSAGTSNAFRISSSLVSTSANSAGLNQILIDPTYNQQTFGTGTIRGIYYNPTVSVLNGSQHTAWENTTGDVLLGTTSGQVGIATASPNAATKLDVSGYCHIGNGTPSTFIGAGHTMEITATSLDAPLTLIGGTSILEIWSDATRSNGAVSYGASYPGLTPDGNIHFATFKVSTSSWEDRIIVEKNEGRVSIGKSSAVADPSSILELSSTVQGFLPPRMTQTQRLAIVSPVEGLIVYDTTNEALGVYSGGGWRKLSMEAF